MTSKKAMAIYAASEYAARMDVRCNVCQYDVANIEYDGLLCRRTINDLKKIWANRCKMLERRMRLMVRYGYEDKELYRTDIEVLRRMWLGITYRERLDVDWSADLI